MKCLGFDVRMCLPMYASQVSSFFLSCPWIECRSVVRVLWMSGTVGGCSLGCVLCVGVCERVVKLCVIFDLGLCH